MFQIHIFVDNIVFVTRQIICGVIEKMSCFTCTGAVNHEFETDLSQIRIVKSCEKELKQKDDKTSFFKKCRWM